MLDLFLLTGGILLNALCILSAVVLRKIRRDPRRKAPLPWLLGLALGGIPALLYCPAAPTEAVLCAVMGGALAGVIALLLLVTRLTYNKESVVAYYNDGSPARFFITGDKHRCFDRVRAFCRDLQTRRKDVLVILGDAGFNYYGDRRDDALKKSISDLPITLFCIHGNKENRPQNIGTYGIRSFCGGKVFYEPEYPGILFAMDGEIYTFEGRKYMVVGGAHSIDKIRCLEKGLPYWHDEMPDEATRQRVEQRLAAEENRIFGMMTHTCPIGYLPTEMFVSVRRNADAHRNPHTSGNKTPFTPDIDRSTENWLGELEKRLDYTVWFCGHYHIDKPIGKVQMLYQDIRPLHLQLSGDTP